MTDIYYRLELLPTEEGKDYYKPIQERSRENAGFDLYLEQDVQTQGGKVSMLSMGCKARMVRCYPDEMEEEVHYWLCPRSSIYKYKISMANSVGVIDKGYRGNLMAPVIPHSQPEGYWQKFSDNFTTHHEPTYVWTNCTTRNEYAYPMLEKGTRLFQIVAPDMGWIKDVRIVDTFAETERGEGGFGSTGSK